MTGLPESNERYFVLEKLAAARASILKSCPDLIAVSCSEDLAEVLQTLYPGLIIDIE